MLSKEEIEKAKQSFKEETDNEIKVYSLVNDYTQSKTDNHKIILEYIEELETKEQKLIEKLEEAIDFAKTGTDLISKAKVECLENVLKILKGENDE